MDPTRMMLLSAAGNFSNKRSTEITISPAPQVGYPTGFGQMFYNQKGRYPRANEEVIFKLPSGNWPGNVSNQSNGIPAVWALGAGWNGNYPKSMRLQLEGSQYGCGGCGMRVHYNTVGGVYVSQLRYQINYSSDGGSIIDLQGTESFINASTPLVIEGNGGLYAGGGGGGAAYLNGTLAPGGGGAGYPVKYFYDGNYDFFINNLTPISGNSQAIGSSGFHSGIGGNAGRFGRPGYTTNQPPSSNWLLGIDPGHPGVIFEYLNGDSRFATQSSILSIFDFSNYNGVINNFPASTWKASYNNMVVAAMFGYKNSADYWGKYHMGATLKGIVGNGRD